MVARLILYRSRIDTDGMSGMDEPVRCIYIDLDRRVKHCGLDGREEVTVTMLMQGYACTDIAEILSLDEWLIHQAFRQAVLKVVRRNNRVWRDTYSPKAGRS